MRYKTQVSSALFAYVRFGLRSEKEAMFCDCLRSNAWQLVSSYRHYNIYIVYWWTKILTEAIQKNVIFCL